MKVYCKNCKWQYKKNKNLICTVYKWDDTVESKDFKITLTKDQFCVMLNKDNNCKSYDRKLWKFWIK